MINQMQDILNYDEQHNFTDGDIEQAISEQEAEKIAEEQALEMAREND